MTQRTKIGLAVLWLALLGAATVLAVPWRFEGEVWLPGSGEPEPVSLPERRWAPLFAPPPVDSADLGLGVADERFQLRLRPVLDRRAWGVQTALVLAIGLLLTALPRLLPGR